MNMKLKTIVLSLSGVMMATSSFASEWTKNNGPGAFNTRWHPTNYTSKFNELPIEGSVENQHIPWSDSYWPKNRGGASFRWYEHSQENARQNITSYEAQQLFFNYRMPSEQEILTMSYEQLKALSPAEKYDIYRGKLNFPMAKAYLNGGRGRKMKNLSNDAYWEGYCNAWSAVSLHYPEPKPVDRAVMIRGQRVVIPFGSGDIKALMVASYAEQLGNNPQMGQFCKKTLTFPATKMLNGQEVFTQYSDTDGLLVTEYPEYLRKFQATARRLGYNNPYAPNPNSSDFVQNLLKDFNTSECQDTNAGAFHILMANQLGLMKEGFVIDKTVDNEIWNQPVFKFKSKVIGPVALPYNKAPTAVSAVQVSTSLYYADDTDYGWTYWNPTLTSLFGVDSEFTKEFLKYQRLLINQGDEAEIAKYPTHVIDKAHYLYNLELDASGAIVGGEWLTFDRPDVAWLPNKFNFIDDFSNLNSLYEPIQIPAGAVANFGEDN